MADHDPSSTLSPADAVDDEPERSLTADVAALFEDGRTYVEAELAFQKSRAAFALDRGKAGALYGVLAFAVLHLALIALVVGAVIALSPVLTPWGATAVVVGVLVLVGVILAWRAKARFTGLASAFREDDK